MSSDPTILWFRQDLRLDDNPALAHAARRAAPLACVYVLDDETPGKWAMGGASRWWLHHSLAALASQLEALGQRLVVLKGNAAAQIERLAGEIEAGAIYWNRCYEPFAIARDGALKAALKARGMEAESFNATALFEPWTITNQEGDPYKVYSPFWRACLKAASPAEPLDPPTVLPEPVDLDSGLDLGALGLLPRKPNWASAFQSLWTPGELGARDRLADFIDHAAPHYAADRDRPDRAATSRLSPHLHFGEISPRRVWHTVNQRREAGDLNDKPADKFLAELGWREFSVHLLFHFPTLPDENFRPEFGDFPWVDDDDAFRAWTQGRTGYPIVDAGMRELWQTGYMHNRVRMIAASFLVKDLLIPWQRGEAWFWDTLIDADLANNAASWQWVAGSGADAAPYFRIFNPIKQGEKFDPQGDYVRRFVPELKYLPEAVIHQPWTADEGTLAKAGLRLGEDYPLPIVDHQEARKAALAAYAKLKNAA